MEKKCPNIQQEKVDRATYHLAEFAGPPWGLDGLAMLTRWDTRIGGGRVARGGGGWGGKVGVGDSVQERGCEKWPGGRLARRTVTGGMLLHTYP